MSLQLPPSANWYSSAACDWSAAPGGLVAFTAKNTVRFFDPATRELQGSLIGHSDRVVSVEFCRVPGTEHLCATASVDLSVRVWDTTSTACLHKLAGGSGGGHAKEVVAASMSAAVAGVVLSADKSGQVLAWNYLTGSVSRSKPLNTAATCVRCARAGRHEAAVAFQNGVVVVVDLAAQPLRRLVGHEGEVHALDWSNPADSADPRGSVLLSSGRDMTLRVWRAADGGRDDVLRVPRGAAPASAAQQSRAWLAARWCPPSPTDGAPAAAAEAGGGGEAGSCSEDWRSRPEGGGRGGGVGGLCDIVSGGAGGDVWVWRAKGAGDGGGGGGGVGSAGASKGRWQPVPVLTGHVSSLLPVLIGHVSSLLPVRTRWQPVKCSPQGTHSRTVFALCAEPARTAGGDAGGSGGRIASVSMDRHARSAPAPDRLPHRARPPPVPRRVKHSRVGGSRARERPSPRQQQRRGTALGAWSHSALGAWSLSLTASRGAGRWPCGTPPATRGRSGRSPGSEVTCTRSTGAPATLPRSRCAEPPPPPSRTNWTCRVLHPVLIGHAVSLIPY